MTLYYLYLAVKINNMRELKYIERATMTCQDKLPRPLHSLKFPLIRIYLLVDIIPNWLHIAVLLNQVPKELPEEMKVYEKNIRKLDSLYNKKPKGCEIMLWTLLFPFIKQSIKLEVSKHL